MPPPPIAMPADRDCRWPPPSMSCTHYVHNELWAVLTRPPCVFPAKCLAFFKGHHLLLRSRKEQIPRGANGIIRVEGEGGARHCTPVSNRKHRRFATTGGSRLAQFPIEFTGYLPYMPIKPVSLKSAVMIGFTFPKFTSAVSANIIVKESRGHPVPARLPACLPGCADPKDYRRTRKAPTTASVEHCFSYRRRKMGAQRNLLWGTRSHWWRGLQLEFVHTVIPLAGRGCSVRPVFLCGTKTIGKETDDGAARVMRLIITQ